MMGHFNLDWCANSHDSQIEDHTRRFSEEYVRRNLGDTVTNVLEDLRDRRFWAVLSYIDGHPFDHTPKKRTEIRKDARKLFTPDELEGIFSLCVESALSPPEAGNDGRPGAYRGHSILYEHLVEKKDSMFGHHVDEKFRKMLNNGRFWESLPRITGENRSQLHIEDVLLKHWDDLDFESKDAAVHGLELFKGANGGIEPHYSLAHISQDAIDKYAKAVFSMETNRRLGQYKEDITKKQIAELVSPYVNEIISRDNDSVLRYSMDKPGSFPERLNHPMVKKYLEESRYVRDSFAERLDLEWKFGHKDFVETVFRALPETVRDLLKAEHKQYLPLLVKV